MPKHPKKSPKKEPKRSTSSDDGRAGEDAAASHSNDPDFDEEAGFLPDDATMADVRDFILQYTPGVRAVYFESEIDQLEPSELRHLYEDPRVFFAAQWNDYTEPGNRSAKNRQKKRRRDARAAHLGRVHLLASGASVVAVMLHDHAAIWRRYYKYLSDNNYVDRRPATDSNQRRARDLLQPLSESAVVGWIMARPRGQHAELKRPTRTALVEEIMAVKPEDAHSIEKSQVSTSQHVQAYDYPPHRKPDPRRSDAGRRDSRSRSSRRDRSRSPPRRCGSRSTSKRASREVLTKQALSKAVASASAQRRDSTSTRTTKEPPALDLRSPKRKSSTQPAPSQPSTSAGWQDPIEYVNYGATDQTAADEVETLRFSVRDLRDRIRQLEAQNEELSHNLFIARAKAEGSLPQSDRVQTTFLTPPDFVSQDNQPMGRPLPTFEPNLPSVEVEQPRDAEVDQETPEMPPLLVKSQVEVKQPRKPVPPSPSRKEVKKRINFHTRHEVLYELDVEDENGDQGA